MNRIPKVEYRTWKCAHCGGRGQETLPAGPWLRVLRQAEGHSLRGLARQLGISPTYLSDQEKSKRKPGLALLLWASERVSIDLTIRRVKRPDADEGGAK